MLVQIITLISFNSSFLFMLRKKTKKLVKNTGDAESLKFVVLE